MGPTEREISWDHFRSYVKHGWEDAALATSWFLFFQWPNREFGMDPGFGGRRQNTWVDFGLDLVWERFLSVICGMNFGVLVITL